MILSMALLHQLIFFVTYWKCVLAHQDQHFLWKKLSQLADLVCRCNKHITLSIHTEVAKHSAEHRAFYSSQLHSFFPLFCVFEGKKITRLNSAHFYFYFFFQDKVDFALFTYIFITLDVIIRSSKSNSSFNAFRSTSTYALPHYFSILTGMIEEKSQLKHTVEQLKYSVFGVHLPNVSLIIYHFLKYSAHPLQHDQPSFVYPLGEAPLYVAFALRLVQLVSPVRQSTQRFNQEMAFAGSGISAIYSWGLFPQLSLDNLPWRARAVRALLFSAALFPTRWQCDSKRPCIQQEGSKHCFR